MRRFDAVIRRIDALVERARDSLPGMTRLPFLVKQVAWSSGEKAPGYEEWQAMERGEIEMSDYPGYEQHNHPAQDEQQRAPRVRVVAPKLYLFDPETEGTEP